MTVRLSVENLPHHSVIGFGDLRVLSVDWTEKATVEATLIADRPGDHRAVFQIGEQIIDAGSVLRVDEPSSIEAVFGDDALPGPPSGTVHVFVPRGAMEIDSPLPMLAVGSDDPIEASAQSRLDAIVGELVYELPYTSQLALTEKAACRLVSHVPAEALESAEHEVPTEDPGPEDFGKPVFLDDKDADRPDFIERLAIERIGEKPDGAPVPGPDPRPPPPKPDDEDNCGECGIAGAGSPRTTIDVTVGQSAVIPLTVCVPEDPALLTVDRSGGGGRISLAYPRK